MGSMASLVEWAEYLTARKRKFAFFKKGYRSEIYTGTDLKLFYSVKDKLEFDKSLVKHFKNLCIAVKKSFNKKIIDSDFYIEPIEKINYSRRRFYKNIDTLKDEEMFYIIDINNAYWFFAKHLRYISPELYVDYIAPNFKIARNIAMSRCTSEGTMSYYLPDGRSYRIKEVCTPYKNIYNNIINSCANLTSSTADALGENCLWHTIDSVAVKEEAKAECISLLKSVPELSIKIEVCFKINGEYYLSPGGFKKKF